MTPIELDGRNLGEKHQHLNQLVREAIADENYTIDEFNIEDGDIKNLLKIEIANKTRNVDYILKVLVCEDSLYVSRAIKQSMWLVTGDEFRNIINPEYLHSTLFPQMNTKSVNKFTKYIQLNLKDTTRAEQFYDYEKSPEKAVYWLPHCSPEFIIKNISKHMAHLKISLIKRLCEKNIMVLETFVEACSPIPKSIVFEATAFVLNSDNINKYLDLVEKLQNYEYPKLNKSNTNLIMRLAPKRIFDKFDNYCNYIHLPTFIKFLKSNNIKTFLLEQASRAEKQNRAAGIFNKHQLQCFFEAMPKEERFDFIKQIFIDKIHTQKSNLLTDSEIRAMSYLYNCIKNKRWYNELQLYQYAPFDIAFSHIKKLITQETQNSDKKNMFSTLVLTAKHNDQNVNSLLQYFREKHLNDSFDLRYQFTKDIICQTNFHKLDQSTWNILEDIMMPDIIDADKSIQVFIESIIIFKVLHSQKVPEILEKKFQFNSLNTYKNRFNKEDEIIIFSYLYDYIKTKLLECCDFKTEQQFDETLKILDLVLNLLNDWNKDLREYPLIISTIKDLLNVKKQNSWKKDLSILYNKNKSWKKWLFEESFELCPCQSVFINAVKHDPTMFERYKSEAEELCLKEKETVIQFLKKIKIYWAQSLTKTWTNVFINKLDNLNNQKASSRGVCILFPREDLLTILNKYAPENAKIDYGNINELNLNLQRCFATNMHIARPQPPPEIILLYAKGDYLKCSLPSLLSIYHNLSGAKSARYISELLNAQVSLQKHAIRFSFIKMKTYEIPTLYEKVWKTSKNTTIRNVLFKTVHDLVCKEKDPVGIETLWNLLEMFIDNLTFNENKNVYDTLLKVSDTPIAIRADFFVKSYTFLKKLQNSKIEYETYSSSLKYTLFPYARDIMDTLPPSFVANILLEFINEDFIKESGSYYTMRASIVVITSYLLTAKDESTQMKKYEEIFVPIVKHCTTSFKENKNRDHCIKNLEILLDKLCEDLQIYFFEKKMVLPIKMFSAIKDDLEKIFSETENYLMLTKWTLALAFTKSLNGHQGCDWYGLCLAAAPQFGKDCYQILYDHSKKYFPRIYILFVRALETILNLFIQNIRDASRLLIYECLIHDKDFVLGYLAALQLCPKTSSDDEECNKQVEKVRHVIFEHPSLEVKMHCHSIILET
ncbi:uncharacterized protein [Maniola hyperantus]|uniref:uncharacterized protein n=1 Tax=Aphantopus hyperantus TaxID=2795564 RepID=UPI00156A678B|nr:uncharacterized protein LOC117984855 [Maniola hyperantus]